MIERYICLCLTTATLSLTGCATSGKTTAPVGMAMATMKAPPMAIRRGPTQFPKTRIPVSEHLMLIYTAGARSRTRPAVGDNGDATDSEYRLIYKSNPAQADADGQVLAMAPSMLPDANTEPEEFRDPRSYLISAFASESRRVIAVMEDASTVLPNAAYLVFRQRSDQTWEHFELPVPAEKTGAVTEGPLAFGYPELEGVSDTELYLQAQDRHWRVGLDSLPHRNERP